MIVLFNCLSSVSGGAIAYLKNLVPLLQSMFEEAERGSRFRIIAHQEQVHIFQRLPNKVFITIRGERRAGYRRAIWEWQNFDRIAAEEKADVIFHPYQIGYSPKDVQCVLMLRNMEPFRFQAYRYPLRLWLRNFFLKAHSRRCLRKANRVIAVSKYAYEFAVRYLGIERSRLRQIYHGRDNGFRPEAVGISDGTILQKIRANGNFLLSPGALLPYRKCEDIIEAFTLVHSKQETVTLILAGAAHDRNYLGKLKSLVRKNRLENRVRFVGHVPQNIMQSFYRVCRLCIIASEVEACPNIAIEAMASACVIVSCDQPPLPEILAECSLQYRAGDVLDLKKKIELGLNDEKVRTKAKNKALMRAQAFSWDKCAQETFSALMDWE